VLGTTIGPYRVVDKLGEGGMGVVYRARDTRLGRDVAIKIMPADLASDPDPSAGSGSSRAKSREDRLRRFELEARTVAALSHPNIVALYDIGTHEGAPYLVSELLEGQTLRDEIGPGGLPVREAVAQAVQIARGLAAAHEKGIVHRDLKPENVFVTRGGHLKILDFGIAKLARPEGESDTTTVTRAASTQAGAVLGTMGYMAPEQVRGLAVDQRTDIFAFGCLLYEMLCGERAFKGATPADTMSAILKEDPPPLGDVRRAVPVAIQQVVDRCLAKRPEDRFSSAHDLGLALETLSTTSERVALAATPPRPVAGPREPAPRPSLAARAVSSVRARPWPWLLGVLGTAAAGAAAVPGGGKEAVATDTPPASLTTRSPSTVRTIFSSRILWRPHLSLLSYEVRGSGFLHHMVRNLVGTLVEIGRGKLTPGDMLRILEARDRRFAGPTAPAQGLCLMNVDY